jgi:tripartite-type tricarboxylate transporter receptor subunit TctC
VKAYVVSASQRLAALPDIPSAKESAINYQMSIWAGIFAPKGTPKEIVAKLAAALDKALDDPSVRKRLGDLGGSIPSKQERTAASFARLVKTEVARWSPILKAASLTTQ